MRLSWENAYRVYGLRTGGTWKIAAGLPEPSRSDRLGYVGAGGSIFTGQT